MVIHRGIYENNQITLFTCFISIPQVQDYLIQGIIFIVNINHKYNAKLEGSDLYLYVIHLGLKYVITINGLNCL